jgi:nicotinamidase-related amidase
VHHLVLCGVSTESCIAATAIEAFAHDLGVTMVRDATASVDRELHDDTLAQLADRYRQEVLDAAEVRERWSAEATAA